MSSSCQDIREDLRLCIVDSACLKRPGMTFHSCLKNQELDQRCKALKTTYFECRRGWFDMTKRMLGNIPGHSEKTEEEQQALVDSGIYTVNRNYKR